MKVKLTVPDNLNELTLKQYQNYLKLEEPNEIDVIREFLYLSDETIKKMPKADVNRVAHHIVSLFEQKPQLTHKFYHNGNHYGFIPDLDKISWGENADVNEYISDWDKIHLAMSVLYRPITKEKKDQYLIEDYKGVNTHLSDMPLGVVLGAINFFFHLVSDLVSYIPNYLLKNLPKDKLKENLSLESGDSTTKSTHSLKETLEGLKVLLNYPYTNVTSFSHMKQTKQTLNEN